MSGLGREKLITAPVPFFEVPGLLASTVTGHAGTLALAEWAGRRVLIFAGRLHYYEGHSWESVTQPMRLANTLGVRTLMLTNAAGGIHPDLGPGSLMAIRDHIDWTGPDSWRRLAMLAVQGPSPYSVRLRHILRRAARLSGQQLNEGLYGAVLGPCYETPAEIRALKTCGADAVGMSTAREVQAAHELGVECAAVSCVTNRAAGLGDGPISHEDVLTSAAAQLVRLEDLIERFIVMI
jgi:purine-nucleoside phosphorylase